MTAINLGPYTPEGSARRRSLLIAPADLWAVHLEGASGEGKSTAMAWLMDAAAAAGESVILIDPKGDLAADYAARTRFPARLAYIAPGLLTDRCVTLNPFEFDRHHPHVARLESIVADNVIRSFEHIGRADTSWMSYIRKYLTAATRLALQEPEPTLLHLICILVDTDYRNTLLRSADDHQRAFWADYVTLTPYVQQTQTESTKGRLWDFLFNPLIRHWVGAYRSSFRVMDLLARGRIVVCNFGHGLSEFEGEILGNLVVSHLMTEYRLRDSLLSDFDRARRIRVFVDEFQDLSPAPFAQVLTNGRAYNIFPVVANQNRAQLADHPRLAEAIKHARVKLMFYGSSGQGVDDLRAHRAKITWRITETKQATLTLRDWWQPANPQQLAAAESAQATDDYTIPLADVREIVPHVRPKQPRKPTGKRRGTIVEDDHHDQTDPSPASGPHEVRPAATQATAPDAGSDPQGDAGPDADRPVRLPNRRPARALALLRAADAGGRPAGPGGGGAGDQPDDPAPPQGPGARRGGAAPA